MYVLGTIRWMAPELCSPPPEPCSFSSDIWSYGCIILETTSTQQPWNDQFNDDSLLFRALQRKENAYIFATHCANQLGPSHLCQLLIQCCAWLKNDRPSFIDILQKLTGNEDDNISIDEYLDCMSTDSSPIATDNSFLEKKDDNKNVQHRLKMTSNNLYEVKSHGGRLTGEVYTSKGSASGRPIYEGSKGGRYYLTPNGSKIYLHK